MMGLQMKVQQTKKGNLKECKQCHWKLKADQGHGASGQKKRKVYKGIS